MKLRLVFVAALVSTFIACQCGGVDPCDSIKCNSPMVCDGQLQRCVVPGPDGGSGGGTGGSGGGTGGATGGGSGGGGASAGCTVSTQCSYPTPVCDPAANADAGRCVTCTTAQGCSGSLPWCEPTAGTSGECWGCRNVGDCTVFGNVCDYVTHTCVPDNTGGGAGGGGAGGGTGGGGGYTWPTSVGFDDAGRGQHCLPFDAGTQACTTECTRGFVCVAGQCVLRGSTGPVQVTLRFPQDEDVDLHVVEPLRDGGSCEIWYGNTNANMDAGIPWPFPFPMPAACGALGWLDLDSNPACTLDHVRIENVITPSTQPPTTGLYRVRVDYYQNCSASTPVDYEVEVRALGQSRFYCGTFAPNTSDHGSAGAGRDITTFTLQ